MLRFIDQIPILPLAVVALVLLLAPFRPMPHALEKLIMLKNGTLTRPLDIFDLVFHLLPTLLLFARIVRQFSRSN